MTSVYLAGRHPAPNQQSASVIEVAKPAWPQTISAAVDERPVTNSPLLTTDQAADYLRVSNRTVKTLLGDGRVPFIKIGRATRIHRNDLDEFIARNRRRQRQHLRPQ